MLWPKRDLAAAKLFLRLPLSSGGPRPRAINVDGHPAYPSAGAGLQQTGELGQRCPCRTAPYLNKIIEQDHRFIKKLDAIRKDKSVVAKGDAFAQRQFIHTSSGVAAQQ